MFKWQICYSSQWTFQNPVSYTRSLHTSCEVHRGWRWDFLPNILNLCRDFIGFYAVFMNLFFALVMRHEHMFSVSAVYVLICVLTFQYMSSTLHPSAFVSQRLYRMLWSNSLCFFVLKGFQVQMLIHRWVILTEVPCCFPHLPYAVPGYLPQIEPECFHPIHHSSIPPFYFV